jgi:methionyl aminopeptidase
VESLQDFGDYEIILPPEPPLFGTSHFTPRSAPKHILKPPYARSDETRKPWPDSRTRIDGSTLSDVGSARRVRENEDDPFYTDPYEGDGKIMLGSADETSLREAGSLARTVLAHARELVEVCSAQ